MNHLKSLSNRYHIVLALLVAALVFTAACSAPVVEVKSSGGSNADVAPLTEEVLRNAEYRGIYQEPVHLTDGKYEGEPFVEGGASRPTVAFTDAFALGDLDSDGVDDAVVVLVESSGGSGSFLYLAAVLNRDGNPENVTTQSLGDRGQVQKLSIESGQMVIEMIAHGPDDPMCCPTQEVTLTYRLEGEQLVKVSEEVADPK
jgi:hypothetical protein